MLLAGLLNKYNSKEELVSLMEELDLPTTGTKKDLLSTIGNKFSKSNSSRVLNLMDSESLYQILVDEELANGNLFEYALISKSEMVRTIRSKILEDGPETIPAKKTKPSNNRPTPVSSPNIREESTAQTKRKEPTKVKVERVTKAVDDDLFLRLVKEIEAYVPPIKFPREDGYQADLNGYLSGKGYRTRLEEGEFNADILVEDSCPIEVKKSPRKSDYNRAFGQIKDYCKKYGCAIVVACDIKSMDGFKDFIEDVEEHFTPKYRVAVIKKG